MNDVGGEAYTYTLYDRSIDTETGAPGSGGFDPNMLTTHSTINRPVYNKIPTWDSPVQSHLFPRGFVDGGRVGLIRREFLEILKNSCAEFLVGFPAAGVEQRFEPRFPGGATIAVDVDSREARD